MKTLHEVIESITQKSGLEIRDARKPEHDRFWVDRETYNDALCYLRMYKELSDNSESYAEWKENPPLNWEDLKTMIGKPVWIEYNLDLEDEDFRKRSRAWFIIDYFEPYNGATLLRSESGFVFVNYQIGIQWQAYRKERE